MELSKNFNLSFKSYESCSIFRTFSIFITISLWKTSIYAYHLTLNFISDPVNWEFLKFAHANFLQNAWAESNLDLKFTMYTFITAEFVSDLT